VLVIIGKNAARRGELRGQRYAGPREMGLRHLSRVLPAEWGGADPATRQEEGKEQLDR